MKMPFQNGSRLLLLIIIIIAMCLFLQGYALVLLTRLLCKIVFRSLLKNLFRVLDLECFEIKKVKYNSSQRLYSPSFKLPPVFYKVRILQQLFKSFQWHLSKLLVFDVISVLYICICIAWSCICITMVTVFFGFSVVNIYFDITNKASGLADKKC